MASRPYWSGFLRFGIVSVPVQLFSASSSTSDKISLNQLHKDCHSRVQYKKACPQHGELKADDIVSGYEYDDGKFVIVDAEEAEKFRPAKEKGINISSFVTDGAIDARYFSGKNYHLTPNGPMGQKPYSLLHRAMFEGGRAALCEIVMRGHKYVALIRPLENILTMSVLEYPATVKGLAEFEAAAPRVEVLPQELKMATMLMDQLAVDDPDLSQYRDDYSDNLQKLIEAKIAGKEVVEAPAEGEEAPQVINLMEALQKSLDAAKKSAAANGKPAKMVASGTAGKQQAARKRKTS